MNSKRNIINMLIFRCDMNSEIATGHVMRCLSIADAARDMGVDSVFITADLNASSLLVERGYKNIVLNTNWRKLEPEIEILTTELSKINVLSKYGKNVLIVDSYSVTNRYLSKLRKCIYTAYIDDYGREIYDVDCLICYAAYAEELGLREKYGSSVKLILGPRFAPLRREFWDTRRKLDCDGANTTISNTVNNILIMSGGSDPYSAIKNIIATLSTEKYENIYAICGIYNKDYEELTELYCDSKQVHIIKSTPNIIEYMTNADIAISAAGSTLYELCALGVPTISYTYADNQLRNAFTLDKQRVISYLGDLRKDYIYDSLKDRFGIMKEVRVRNRLSMKMKELCDARGAWNIVTEIN